MIHDNYYRLSSIPAFDLRTPASAGWTCVSELPATTAPEQREVLPSTSNVASVLYWTSRVPTHSSLRPAANPRILSTPRLFSQPAESLPIARRPRPRRAASFNRFLCAIPRRIVARARLPCCGTAQRNLCIACNKVFQPPQPSQRSGTHRIAGLPISSVVCGATISRNGL